ncbi:DNA cytosine methyltransferase [Pseudomonas cannabina]|uniref:DNA cytosine methyltransferase n=1 Tax=Pseudomonas cannabina TaxID=86840 RepID=UPI001605371E|nr:DNA cytosine methyltransferase [Pseudomonas cannabina]
MRGYYIKNIGQNRGKPRIWMEKLEITTAGFAPGDHYEVQMKGGSVVLRADPNGSRVVSSKPDKKTGGTYPIIDLASESILALFDGMAAIRLVQREGEIHLLPLATEIRKKERLNRIKHKVNNKLPLDVGSLSHGGGLLAHAVHEGLANVGLDSVNRMANEIRPELLEHASQVSDAWTENTLVVGAPMQTLAFDDAAMRHVPRIDVMEAGLPCSGASVAGRARRGTSKAEDHPEVGHLVVAALVIIAKANPAVLLLENVVPYASTASASILRNQLRDLGYNTHETVLKGSDFNALEHRDRWCMVAVTEGMHFDWGMLQIPERQKMQLSDVLEPIADDDPAWQEMAGLKRKQERDIADGKSFLMQTFNGASEKIGTIGKGYAKVRSTEPKIEHPTNPDLLRQITETEHVRIKQFPESIIQNLSMTIAHEILGQGVLKMPFVAATELVGRSIIDFAGDIRPADLAELANAMALELQDSASMVVAEIRPPLAGVLYEGPITVSEIGMVIQDIGNGVGILHKSDALANVKLGETLKIKYPKITSAPLVEHLNRPAAPQSETLISNIAEANRQQGLFEQTETNQRAPAPNAMPTTAAEIQSIYKDVPTSIYKGPRL